jgi:hypothetical protein
MRAVVRTMLGGILFSLGTIACGASAIGCGGKVIFTEGGGEGTGGGGAGAPATPESACAALCAKLPQCIETGGDPASCESNCALGILPECEQESAELFQCLAEELPADCIPTPGTCTGEIFALADCGGISPPSP